MSFSDLRRSMLYKPHRVWDISSNSKVYKCDKQWSSAPHYAREQQHFDQSIARLCICGETNSDSDYQRVCVVFVSGFYNRLQMRVLCINLDISHPPPHQTGVDSGEGEECGYMAEERGNIVEENR